MRKATVVLIVLSICIVATRAVTNCPHQCVCEDNNIVCSCDSTPFSKLVISSLGGSYIASLTIHSCGTVFVTNGSFAGVVLSDRLSFIGINRLTFEPQSFRGILQSPRQLVIDKCTLPVLLPNTFTGLAHMEHIWFRNSTIGKLSTNAFFHLAHVNYLYFRDVTFKHIERRAFGKMYSIGHLFMSGVIRVEESEDSLFASSSVEELLIEGLNGQLDVAFLLGADIRSAIIRQSTIKCENVNEGKVTQAPGSSSLSSTRKLNSITFNNVTSTVLVLYFLAHFNQINFHNSSIGSIATNPDLLREHIHSNISFNFLDTMVDHIESHAFNGLSVDILNINNSRIKHVSRLAVAGAIFGHVHITGTELGMLDELVFADVCIGSLEMTDTRIDRIPPRAFENSQVENITIRSSKIKILASKAFSNSSYEALTMKNTIVNNVEPQPFLHLQVKNVHIADCAFHGSSARHIFTGFVPVRLIIINSTFSCDPHDCEINAMLLRPLRQELSWTFLGNKCHTPEIPSTALCAEPSKYFHEGLSCRLNWAVADCLCTETSASLTRFNTSVVVIGDCDYLNINASEGSTAALYLFRINECDVVHIPSTVKTIEMFHTNLVIHKNAIQYNRIDSLLLSHTNMCEAAPSSMHNVSIRQMTAEHSTLSNWDLQALEATKIVHANIMNSRLSAVQTLLNAVSHMRIQNSVLLDFDGLSKLDSVYLSNNTLLCCCTDRENRCMNGALTETCVRHFDAFDCNSSHRRTNLFESMLVYICVAYVAR